MFDDKKDFDEYMFRAEYFVTKKTTYSKNINIFWRNSASINKFKLNCEIQRELKSTALILEREASL